MGIESNLLRSLEPIVRPDGASRPRLENTDPARNQPFEARGFDSLLEEAQQAAQPLDETVGGEPTTADEPTKRPGTTPPSPFTGVDRIENASLRLLVERRAADRDQTISRKGD